MRAEGWRAGHNKRFSIAKRGYKEHFPLSLNLQFRGRHQLPLQPEGTCCPFNWESPKHWGSHLLLLLSSNTTVNPAQSFITKAWEKRVLGMSFRLWTQAGQRGLFTALGEAPNQESTHPSLMRSSLVLSIAFPPVDRSFDSTLSCPALPTASWGSPGTQHMIPTSVAKTWKVKCWSEELFF